jgi:poly-gamma-glutamate synthesis protein (capsule biosynthesis protein)
MKNSWMYLFFIPLFLFSETARYPEARIKSSTTVNDTLTCILFFAGDVMGHGPQIEAARCAGGLYRYGACFESVKPFIERADFAVANLEVTLAGPPYTGYPTFSSPDSLALALKNAGFDMLLTSNNHCYDKGRKGMERTLTILDSLHLKHTGTFRDSTERRSYNPLYVNTKGLKLAFLNYTYGTNGYMVQEPNRVNRLDSSLIERDIRQAVTSGADLIVVLPHWGIEYHRYPSEKQQQWADYFIHLGADAIIGAHPHVVQPVEVRKGAKRNKVIAWSLGNMVSNQRERYKDGGIGIYLTIKKYPTDSISIEPAILPFWVNKTDKYRILPITESIDSSDISTIEDRRKMNQFFTDTRELLKESVFIQK